MSKQSVVVITGAASGMGRVFALRMAAQGMHVSAVDRQEEALAALAEEQALITPHAIDVTDSRALQNLANELIEQHGTIDRLVCCAAIMPTELLATEDAELTSRVMAINYGGTVNVVRAVIPGMLSRGQGEIVIFGSSGGAVLIKECGAYCASKAATNAYAEILTEELRDSAVHVMLVCPPLVDTPLIQQAVNTANPATIALSLEGDRFVSPEFIIDEVERGLQRRTEILKPGMEAKLMMWLRRFSPRLVWTLLDMSAKNAS